MVLESLIPQPSGMLAHYELPRQEYYEMSFASSAYPARLQTVERLVCPGMTVLDIGCNDGRMLKHLLSSGRAARGIAVDLQDLIRDKPSNLEFFLADVTEFDLRQLGRVDVVLVLNVLHHVVNRSRSAALDLIGACVELAPHVLVDMGSFSERGPWPWRRAFERYWRNDQQMWADIFGSLPRRALLRYAGMNGGHRTLWLLNARPSC